MSKQQSRGAQESLNLFLRLDPQTANSCPPDSWVLRLSSNIYKERLVEQNQEINRQCPWWRAEIEMFVGTDRVFTETAPSLGLSLPSCFWLPTEGRANPHHGLTLFCCTGHYNLLICTLWVLNCKATFLGTKPRALEEGYAFKLCFLGSFPSVGAAALAADQSPGIPVLCSDCSSRLRSHHSPPFCLVLAGSIL